MVEPMDSKQLESEMRAAYDAIRAHYPDPIALSDYAKLREEIKAAVMEIIQRYPGVGYFDSETEGQEGGLSQIIKDLEKAKGLGDLKS